VRYTAAPVGTTSIPSTGWVAEASRRAVGFRPSIRRRPNKSVLRHVASCVQTLALYGGSIIWRTARAQAQSVLDFTRSNLRGCDVTRQRSERGKAELFESSRHNVASDLVFPLIRGERKISGEIKSRRPVSGMRYGKGRPPGGMAAGATIEAGEDLVVASVVMSTHEGGLGGASRTRSRSMAWQERSGPSKQVRNCPTWPQSPMYAPTSGIF